MDPQQISWPEAGPSSAPMNTAPPPVGLAPSQPLAGPSRIILNSPHFAVPSLPLDTGNGRGRGRGRGLRGVGRGRGRGRGARGGGLGGSGGGTFRQSTRISTRSTYDGNPGKLKLSLKMNASGGGEVYGAVTDSFLGPYDRELDDNPEEPLEFEEQFIMRVPKDVAEGKNGQPGLKEIIKGKGLEALEMKFLDSRRAAVRIGGATYSSKLVDLPCIIESQKTHDSRHLFKVADISQMLVVGPQVASEANIPTGQVKEDEYPWPHGLTPPLRHVRKRRFRKRLSRRTIEVVEEQVEDLMMKDEEAETSTFDLIDAIDPEAPDSYYAEYDHNAPMPWQAYNPSEGSYGDPGSVMPSEAQWDEGDEDAEGEEEDEFDTELANALMEEMEGGSGESEDDDGFGEGDADDGDEAGEDGEEDEDEDDEETAEKKAKIRQFASEIKQLEAAIDKKRAGFQGGNPIMIKRFEETIAGMQNDINTKAVARQVLVDEVERDKPAPGPSASESGQAGGTAPGSQTAPYSDEEDLFGDADAAGDVGVPPNSQQDTPRSLDTPEMEEDNVSMGGAETPASMAGEGGQETEGEEEDGDTDGQEEGGEEEVEDGEEGAEEVDEMEEMLAAVMGAGEAEAQDQSDALAAIDDMDLQDDLDQLGGDLIMPSSPAVDEVAQDFSRREGGVGARRLVEGAEEDDSGSSDDSDD